jgi:signal transduction histidine kinase
VGLFQLSMKSLKKNIIIDTAMSGKIEFNNVLVNPIIMIDKMKIPQIMNNLINNANKFYRGDTND